MLRTLYFTDTGKDVTRFSLADQQDVEAQQRGVVIPMHLGYTASDAPVVGTSLEYFSHRKLAPLEARSLWSWEMRRLGIAIANSCS